MPLTLYADECVDARIVAGLRRRGVDVVSAADEGLLGAPDETHLDRATASSRVVVTNDHDFLRIAHERAEEGRPHSGVLFILPQTSVGEAIRGVALAAEVLGPTDMHSWIEWIP